MSTKPGAAERGEITLGDHTEETTPHLAGAEDDLAAFRPASYVHIKTRTG